MLMKLTPGVNFINVLRTAFVLVDPESIKIQLSHQCLFTLSGPTSVKAVHRTLMKLTPDVLCDVEKEIVYFSFRGKESRSKHGV
jgi:hypothetical protein